jgi:LysR family nod box-dependent transcriptional activator
MTNPERTLRTVNMNLLPVLAELLRCVNVTKAASRLHLTQSTVSGSLRQLRELYGDDLLVQRGRDMVLTEKALHLLPEVERIMEIAGRLFYTADFEPLTAQNSFRIATADYVSALVGSRLGKTMQAQAPQVSLTLKPTPGTSAKELRLGSLDLIICPDRRANLQACGIVENDPEFGYEVFMHDQLVAIQCAAHPSAGHSPSYDEYFDRPHVMYCRTDDEDTIEQEALSRLGIRQRTQFLMPYYTLLPQMVMHTNLIGLVPRSLAVRYSKLFPLDIFTPPFELPPLDLIMVWARNREAHADMLWLRRIVLQVSMEQH